MNYAKLNYCCLLKLEEKAIEKRKATKSENTGKMSTKTGELTKKVRDERY